MSEWIITAWGAIMSGIFFYNCSRGPEERLLAVGGIHIFEKQTSCQLGRVEPEGAIKNLNWVDALALEAKSEGKVEVMCGPEKFILKVVAPVRLEIAMLDKSVPTEIAVHERFKVRAKLYDQQGGELEVGKFTHFQWTASGVLQIANDSSSGEFGFCDTCYGMHGFRAVRPGKGLITASLNSLQGTLVVATKP